MSFTPCPDPALGDAATSFDALARAEQGRGVSRDEPTATGRTGARDGNDS